MEMMFDVVAKQKFQKYNLSRVKLIPTQISTAGVARVPTYLCIVLLSLAVARTDSSPSDDRSAIACYLHSLVSTPTTTKLEGNPVRLPTCNPAFLGTLPSSCWY